MKRFVQSILAISVLLFATIATTTDPVTPNLGLTLTAVNEANWNVPVNNNFTLIDTAVAGKQTHSPNLDLWSAVAPSAYQTALGYMPLNSANNLNDVVNKASALANLGAQAALGYTPAHSGTNSDITSLSGLTVPYEPALGNPLVNGYVLSSTTAGVRSWIAPGSGGGGSFTGGVLTSALIARVGGIATGAAPFYFQAGGSLLTGPTAGAFEVSSDLNTLYYTNASGPTRRTFAFLDSSITGSAATATALAANGTNCSSGYAALGVDASGNAEGCWQVTPAAIGAQAALTNPVTGPISPTAGALIKWPASGYGVVDAGEADVVKLFGSGSCSGYLKSDGTCDAGTGGSLVPYGTATQYQWAWWNDATHLGGASVSASSPVWSDANGKPTATATSQTANYFYAAPNGSPGAPTFRGILAADVPALANYLPLAGGTMTGPLVALTPSAGGSGYASINLPHGAAPTTNIANGDIWTTTAGMYARINGATVGPFGVAGSATDANAIHVNVDSEISGITAKATPIGADYMVIEDSAASNAKKSITINTIPVLYSQIAQMTSAHFLGLISDASGSGAVLGGTSPAITTPWITTGIKDANGNPIVYFTATGSAVDYLMVTNSATGTHSVGLSAIGSDTNISLAITGKGTGKASIDGTAAGLSGTPNITIGTINSLTPTALSDGFSIAGGTTSRTLTVNTGAVTLTGNSAGSALVLPSGSTTLGAMATASGSWASPGAAIGTGTPVAGTFTTLTANSLTINKTSGTASTLSLYNDSGSQLYGVLLQGPTGSMSSAYTLQYPNVAPSPGQVLAYGTPCTWATPLTTGANTFTAAQNLGGYGLTDVGSIGIRDTSAAYDVTMGATSSTTLTGAHSFTLDVGNYNATLKFPAGQNNIITTPAGTKTLLANDLSNLTISSQAQGDILYFNGSNWVRLGAGTSGQFLETLGTGANPQWATVSGGGGGSGGASYSYNAVATDISASTGVTDGPSVTLAAGTWLISGQITWEDTLINPGTTDIQMEAKLWDGTNVYGSAGYSNDIAVPSGDWYYSSTLSITPVKIVLTQSTTLKISLYNGSLGTAAIKAATVFGSYTDASYILAVNLGTGGTLTATNYPTYATTSATSTQNINIDGALYNDYSYGPGTGTAGVYTPVITTAPPSGTVRYITLDLNGGTNGITTVTWTNVTFMGTSGATSVAASKHNRYVCKIPSSGNALCSIIAEASTN